MNKKLLPLFFMGFLLLCPAGKVNATCKAKFSVERLSGNTFKLSDSSTINSTTIYTIIINDGTTTHSMYFPAQAFAYYTSYIKVENNGTTRVTLLMHDSIGGGCNDSTSRTISIYGNKPCRAEFGTSSLSGKQVLFGNVFKNNKYSKVYIDFGDGNNSADTGHIFSHTYTKCGSYTVTRRVNDSVNNCKDTFSNTFTLGLKTGFDINPYGGKMYGFNNKTYYNEHFHYLYQDTPYIAFHWDFGDGDTSNEYSPNHQYSTPGTYIVKLITHYTHPVNVCRTTDTAARSLVVQCSITPMFTYSVAAGKTYYYTNLTYGTNLKYLWRFGDTTTSTLKNPSHTFTTYKNYYTRLVAMDTLYNCKDSVTLQSIYCNIHANLYLEADSNQAYQAKLYNYTSGAFNQHYWDFGDGSTSTSAAPTHNYTITGYIQLVYVASSSITGCSDTAHINFTIDSTGHIKRKAFTFTIIDKTNNTKVDKVENSLGNYKIYPNPFVNALVIESGSIGNIQSIAVINIVGQEMKAVYEMNGNKYFVRLDKELEKGIYFVKISTDDGVRYLKVLKE